MSALILLSLPLSIFLMAIITFIAFMDVALRPLELRTQNANSNRSPVWPALEMLGTTSQLALGVSAAHASEYCPDVSFVPQVTDFEAQAIANQVKRLGAPAVALTLEQSIARRSHCPMRRSDGLCACALIRPLSCLGRCVAGGDSPEWTQGLGDTISAAFHHHLENHHANARTRRLDDALAALLDEEQITNATVG